MAATDATFVPVKNQAYRWTFVILEADADPVTGAAGLDSEVSKDGGAFADCTNESVEVAQGVYYLDLTATEMNADTVVVVVKSSTTGAKYAYGIFTPQETGTELKVDVTHAAATAWASGAVTAAALAADAGNEIADAILDRNMATGTDSGGRTVRNALRFLRNKWTSAGGTLTVYKEDDATSAWTAAQTTTAGNPTSEIDPS